jgi:hypothetical protein
MLVRGPVGPADIVYISRKEIIDEISPRGKELCIKKHCQSRYPEGMRDRMTVIHEGNGSDNIENFPVMGILPVRQDLPVTGKIDFPVRYERVILGEAVFVLLKHCSIPSE